jgi:hypothetical protein
MRYMKYITSLRGCQPTVEQLGRAWDQVLDGFDCPDRCVELTHLIEPSAADDVGSQFGLSPRLQSERIESAELGELADDMGEWRILGNLILCASQEEPYRRVIVKIGPGPDTVVEFEAVVDDRWMITSYEMLVKDLSLCQRFYKIWRGVLKVLKDLPPPVAMLVWLVAGIACAYTVFGVLVFLIAPPYNVISAVVRGKNPSESNILSLLWTFMVIILAWTTYEALRSFRRSYVRRLRPPLFSTENANLLLGIGSLVATVAGIVVAAVR